MSNRSNGIPTYHPEQPWANVRGNSNSQREGVLVSSTDRIPDYNIYDHDLARFTNNDYTRDDVTLAFGDLDIGISSAFNTQRATQNDLSMRPEPSLDFKSSIESRIEAQARHFFPPYEAAAAETPLPATLPLSRPLSTQSTSDQSELNNESPLSSRLSPDQSTRNSPDQVKKKRNTAASARFREKKRQREQYVEQSLKESRDRKTELSNRIDRLESENRSLRNILNGRTDLEETSQNNDESDDD